MVRKKCYANFVRCNQAVNMVKIVALVLPSCSISTTGEAISWSNTLCDRNILLRTHCLISPMQIAKTQVMIKTELRDTELKQPAKDLVWS